MVHLHVHTMYSLLDSNIKINELLARVKELGQDTIAITDHGNMYGSVEFYKAAKEAGVKPIVGCECYICENVEEKNKESITYHLLLLAKNETGRCNLQKIVSESTQYKYRGKPRIDFSMLEKYHEGLVCTSACMAGELSRAISHGLMEAKRIAERYKTLFGDDYYIEYQAHSDSEQQQINRQLVMLAKSLDIKFIVTCDAHYLRDEDQKYHSIFVKIGSTREVGETYTDCFIQSEAEVLERCVSTSYNDNITAIANTHEIADKCNVDYPLSAPIIPHTNIPNKFKTEKDYLMYLCNKGFTDKGFSRWSLEQWTNYMSEIVYDEYGNSSIREFIHVESVKQIVKIYKERAKYEINAVAKMGFEGYYLLVRSYISSAKRRGIARGSAGGSLLAYLSGIVDIDPIKYGLYFERFIDVGAVELLKSGQITRKELKIPDVDADFSPTDRDKVMQYIIQTYGEENVVCLGTFQYLWAKSAIKDIGKTLGIPFDVTNEMTKNLNDETIDEALERGLLDRYKDIYPELFLYASKLTGLPKSHGVHACGKVISMKNAVYYNALEYDDKKKVWVLEGDMHTADDLGLVKIDLLGLRTLDVIYDVLDMVGKPYDFISPHKIDMSDKLVWNEFSKGNSLLIFQFESQGMRQMLKEMKCNSIDDLSAANALYRPGSKAYIPNYIVRKNGTEEIVYLHPDLEPILKNTYGIIVYQEQLIEIGRLAKLSNPDELRKATAKKKPKLMAKIEPELKQGLIQRGWDRETCGKLWDDILAFAKYSFNKSHSAAYAITAYITMYLKCHYPGEFITAAINSYDGDITEIAQVIGEAKRLGVNYYFDRWQDIKGATSFKDGVVYLGVNTIKGCGKNVSIALKEVGKSNPGSFMELLQLLDANENIDSAQIEALIRLNIFSEFGKRKKLIKMYELMENVLNKKIIKKDKMTVDESTLKLFSKETEKQYKILDNVGLYNALCEKIPNEDFGIKQQIKDKFSYQGVVDYVNKQLKNYCYVIDMNTKYSPKIKLYFLDSGVTEVYKISKKLFVSNPLEIGDVVYVGLFKKKFKMEKVGDEWIQNTTAYDTWVEKYIKK